MNREEELKQRVLSIYPTQTGFAFAFFEDPKNMVDWGNCCLKPEGVNLRLQTLVDAFNPSVIVTEDNIELDQQRCEQGRSALNTIYQLAEKNQIVLEKLTRSMVKDFFSRHEAENKYQIAKLLSKWIPGLNKLPTDSPLCDGQQYRMGLFDAAAFALTYYYLFD